MRVGRVYWIEYKRSINEKEKQKEKQKKEYEFGYAKYLGRGTGPKKMNVSWFYDYDDIKELVNPDTDSKKNTFEALMSKLNFIEGADLAYTDMIHTDFVTRKQPLRVTFAQINPLFFFSTLNFTVTPLSSTSSTNFQPNRRTINLISLLSSVRSSSPDASSSVSSSASSLSTSSCPSSLTLLSTSLGSVLDSVDVVTHSPDSISSSPFSLHIHEKKQEHLSQERKQESNSSHNDSGGSGSGTGGGFAELVQWSKFKPRIRDKEEEEEEEEEEEIKQKSRSTTKNHSSCGKTNYDEIFIPLPKLRNRLKLVTVAASSSLPTSKIEMNKSSTKPTSTSFSTASKLSSLSSVDTTTSTSTNNSNKTRDVVVVIDDEIGDVIDGAPNHDQKDKGRQNKHTSKITTQPTTTTSASISKNTTTRHLSSKDRRIRRVSYTPTPEEEHEEEEEEEEKEEEIKQKQKEGDTTQNQTEEKKTSTTTITNITTTSKKNNNNNNNNNNENEKKKQITEQQQNQQQQQQQALLIRDSEHSFLSQETQEAQEAQNAQDDDDDDYTKQDMALKPYQEEKQDDDTKKEVESENKWDDELRNLSASLNTRRLPVELREFRDALCASTKMFPCTTYGRKLLDQLEMCSVFGKEQQNSSSATYSKCEASTRMVRRHFFKQEYGLIGDDWTYRSVATHRARCCLCDQYGMLEVHVSISNQELGNIGKECFARLDAISKVILAMHAARKIFYSDRLATSGVLENQYNKLEAELRSLQCVHWFGGDGNSDKGKHST